MSKTVLGSGSVALPPRISGSAVSTISGSGAIRLPPRITGSGSKKKPIEGQLGTGTLQYKLVQLY